MRGGGWNAMGDGDDSNGDGVGVIDSVAIYDNDGGGC